MISPENKCFYCRAFKTRTIKFEEHHIYGRVESPLSVNICENCHRLMHNEIQQKELPKIARQKDAPSTIKALNAFLLWSIHNKRIAEEGEKLARQAIQDEVKKYGNSICKDNSETGE
jgi:hypothetical protein